MQKINILYVITKLELGGAQKQLYNLIRGLSKKKFNILLLTAKEGFLLDDFLSLENLTLRKSAYLERRINPFKDFLACIEIYRYIKANRIDIVHTHSSKAGIVGRFAARLARVKWIIHTVHGWSFNDFQPAVWRIFFIWLERFAALWTNRFIVVSNCDRQKGVALGIGQEQQYSLIRYGIGYSEFSKKDEDTKKEWGIKKDDLVVGMVSCLKPQKSPQDFVKVARLIHRVLPEAKFILVGDGVLRPRVQELIERLGLNGKIILTGWRRDIFRMLSVMDVFILTSLWEGLPIAALEAMSVSLPVVATNTGGIAEVVVDHKTGFLVKTHDMDSLSEKLRILLKDKRLRIQMGEQAKNSLGADFTLPIAVKNTQDLYCSLLQENFN
jgi:glycosyltransferase involved in cell wall biosynthesis